MTDANDFTATGIDPAIAPQGDNPLPRINTDPAKAPDRVAVEWILTSPVISIGPQARPLCLLRGKFGEVQVRSIRVQFPMDLPEDFESWQLIFRSSVLVAKRGIVVSRLQGKNRASCHCDLPLPATEERSVAPLLTNQFLRSPVGAVKCDYWLWAGQRSEMTATPRTGLALVAWANYPVAVQAMIGGV